MMKFLKTVLCISAVLFMFQTAAADVGVKAGQSAPDFSLKNLKGDTVKLRDYKGKKVVILDFWASWCGPCLRAIPELNRIQKDYEYYLEQIINSLKLSNLDNAYNTKINIVLHESVKKDINLFELKSKF